jgi:hypothetical protein
MGIKTNPRDHSPTTLERSNLKKILQLFLEFSKKHFEILLA